MEIRGFQVRNQKKWRHMWTVNWTERGFSFWKLGSEQSTTRYFISKKPSLPQEDWWLLPSLKDLQSRSRIHHSLVLPLQQTDGEWEDWGPSQGPVQGKDWEKSGLLSHYLKQLILQRSSKNAEFLGLLNDFLRLGTQRQYSTVRPISMEGEPLWGFLLISIWINNSVFSWKSGELYFGPRLKWDFPLDACSFLPESCFTWQFKMSLSIS